MWLFDLKYANEGMMEVLTECHKVLRENIDEYNLFQINGKDELLN